MRHEHTGNALNSFFLLGAREYIALDTWKYIYIAIVRERMSARENEEHKIALRYLRTSRQTQTLC